MGHTHMYVSFLTYILHYFVSPWVDIWQLEIHAHTHTQAEISEGVKNLSIDRLLCMSICKPPPLIAPVDLCPLFFSSVFTPTCSHSPVFPFPSFIPHLPVELLQDRLQGLHGEDIASKKGGLNYYCIIVCVLIFVNQQISQTFKFCLARNLKNSFSV